MTILGGQMMVSGTCSSSFAREINLKGRFRTSAHKRVLEHGF